MYFQIGHLLSWHKEVLLNLASKNYMVLSENVYDKYVRLFENCPELKTLFNISPDKKFTEEDISRNSLYTLAGKIVWAEGLSKEEQNEIRNYIHENYKVEIRIRRNRLPGNK